MHITVTVKPSAKEEKIERINESSFKVAVKAPPVQGLANREVCRLFAQYFGVSPAQVKIIAGATQRRKIVEIE